MGRPTKLPDWATDTDFPAGSDPWSSQPNKVDPGGLVATGFIPQQMMAAEHSNYMFNNHGQWIDYLADPSRRIILFDDFDGNWVRTSSAAAGTGQIGTTLTIQSGSNYDVAPNIVTSFPTGTAGWATCQNHNTGAAVNNGWGPASILFGAQDWIFRAGIYIPARANLQGISDPGFFIGLSDAVVVDGGGLGNAIGFLVASDKANWQVVGGGGTAINTPTAFVDATYFDIEITRSGNTLTYFVNGVQIYLDLGGSLTANPYQLGFLCVNPSLTSRIIAAIDYIGFETDRA